MSPRWFALQTEYWASRAAGQAGLAALGFIAGRSTLLASPSSSVHSED